MNTKTIENHVLHGYSMGTRRFVTIIRYGSRKTGKKAYIQAGLHADEPPGFVIMHHLIDILDQADISNKISGEIILVPVANPVGLSQWRDDMLQGRFNFTNGINFNRDYPDFFKKVAESVNGKLYNTAEKNVALIRETISENLSKIEPKDETEYLKHLLLSLSFDSDIVLDLHCDYQAALHVYLGTPLWPQASDLPAQVGSEVTLLSSNSGGNPFDEACSRIWWDLADKFPEFPIPMACLASTVEFRGETDVSHEYGIQDAKNIFYFLQRRGFVLDKAPELPPLLNDATPLRGVEHIIAPCEGVVIFFKKPGEFIEAGDKIAEIINPVETARKHRVTPVTSTIDGILFARSSDRYARPGRIIAKIAGKKPLRGKGDKLLTL